MTPQRDKAPEAIYLDALRIEVWKKVIGNNQITKGNHYYEQIRAAILRETAFSLSKDTIRNFCEKKHIPSPKTLDIYSTFVLEGDETNPKTFSDFQNWYATRKTQQAPVSYWKSNAYKYFVFVGGVGLSLFIVGAVFFHIVARKPKITIPFYDRFYNSNLVELNKKGWDLFPDSINLKVWDNPKYSSNGYLTLETFPGGPWLVNKKYKPKTINILAKEIFCGECCEIEVKLVGFNPYQPYQQAGFFLFYEKTPFKSNSFLHAGTNLQNHIQWVYRDGEYSNKHIVDSQLRRTKAKISKVLDHKKGIVKRKVDSLIIRVTVKLEHIFLEYKVNNNEFYPVISRRSTEYSNSKYIGLAAFQGRPDVPFPVRPLADTIPANFEYVRLIPCDQ